MYMDRQDDFTEMQKKSVETKALFLCHISEGCHKIIYSYWKKRITATFGKTEITRVSCDFNEGYPDKYSHRRNH